MNDMIPKPDPYAQGTIGYGRERQARHRCAPAAGALCQSLRGNGFHCHSPRRHRRAPPGANRRTGTLRRAANLLHFAQPGSDPEAPPSRSTLESHAARIASIRLDCRLAARGSCAAAPGARAASRTSPVAGRRGGSSKSVSANSPAHRRPHRGIAHRRKALRQGHHAGRYRIPSARRPQCTSGRPARQPEPGRSRPALGHKRIRVNRMAPQSGAARPRPAIHSCPSTPRSVPGNSLNG